jgi:hypothetical protein
MASLRKRYAEEPVTTATTGGAKLPDAVEPKAAEPLVVKNPDPVETAAKDAIALQLRLKEMERAERLQQEAVQQPLPQAAEPPQQQQPQQPMPAHIEKWLAEHPEYMNPNDHVA